MWYVVIDGRIHFTTFAKSQKVLTCAATRRSRRC